MRRRSSEGYDYDSGLFDTLYWLGVAVIAGAILLATCTVAQ